MAFPFDGPELKGEARTEGVTSRNLSRSRQAASFGQGIRTQADQVGHEEKQAADLGCEAVRGERKGPGVGHRLGCWLGPRGPFRLEPPGQCGEALGFEHFSHGGGAQAHPLFFERGADLVDGAVLLAQFDDQLPSG